MEQGMLIIAMILMARHLKKHNKYRNFYKESRKVNQEHLEALMTGGRMIK